MKSFLNVKYILIAGILFLIKFPDNVQAQQPVKELHVISSGEIPEGKVPEILHQGLNITTLNGSFVDACDRTMFLRGINLSGSTKVPYSPYMGSHIKDGFYNGKDISFVGRPFPLEKADEHFARLKTWGFDFLRFLVTWEAIEHDGPGIYDTSYLEYIRSIILKAGEYGINVMIDPHQDVWSRYTGGDGAPLWTFEVAGMDVTGFQKTGAAFIHNVYGDPFPKMIWYTNYYKLASATMFTLFFGGNDFAPNTLVDGQPIQEYLQEHYINALKQVAEQIKDLPNVIGFELMNEPSAGYIGIENLALPYHTDIIGSAPSPFQGMLLGAGISQTIPNYRLGAASLKENKPELLNVDKYSAWKQNCAWRENGVWDINKEGIPILLAPNYFSVVNGKTVDFNTMYYKPFIKRYTNAILSVNPEWFICVDNILYPYPHVLPDLKDMKDVKWLNGSHWYDDVTLVKKRYIPFLGLNKGEIVVGKKNVRKAFKNCLADMIKETHQQYGKVPTLLGEFGIPFDMNKGKAFKTGNYNKQAKALNRSFEVAEANLLNYTLWNYTADNTNERGDLWNGEDLSIFSLSQQTDTSFINSGGRALEVVIRPYPKKLTGKLTGYDYDYKSKTLTVSFEMDELYQYPTEIFVPEFVYHNHFIVHASEGKLCYDKKENILMFYPSKKGANKIILKAQ